jgi:hypothetical protein
MKAARELKKQNPSARLDPIEMSLRELAEADEKTLEAALILRGAASEAKTTLEALASESVPTNREGEAPAEP